MAFKNGCNAYMAGPNGTNSTRMQPQKNVRANLSKGGVNDHLGGTTESAPKMDLKAGQSGIGKRQNDKR